MNKEIKSVEGLAEKSAKRSRKLRDVLESVLKEIYSIDYGTNFYISTGVEYRDEELYVHTKYKELQRCYNGEYFEDLSETECCWNLLPTSKIKEVLRAIPDVIRKLKEMVEKNTKDCDEIIELYSKFNK